MRRGVQVHRPGLKRCNRRHRAALPDSPARREQFTDAGKLGTIAGLIGAGVAFALQKFPPLRVEDGAIDRLSSALRRRG
jgi:hypothetical protein